jgi:AcrR family transcriptional regulator
VPGSGKQSYHHGDLKKVLLDESARMLREEGEAALSLRKLAANVGVSHTACYHHFKNKQDLLSAIAEEGFARYNLAMDAAIKKSRGLGGQRSMQVYVKAYVNFAVKNREYYDLMYGGKLWQTDTLTDSLRASARGTLRRNVENIQHGQERGRVNKDLDALQFSQVSWGAMHGVSRLFIDGIYTDSASLKKLCETTADILWLKLRPG